jgi:hypothetical protein
VALCVADSHCIFFDYVIPDNRALNEKERLSSEYGSFVVTIVFVVGILRHERENERETLFLLLDISNVLYLRRTILQLCK